MDANQCADLVRMVRKSIGGGLAILAFMICATPLKDADASTLETEARLEVRIDSRTQVVENGPTDPTAPLPDFKPLRFVDAEVSEFEASQTTADLRKTGRLPKLNEWVRNKSVIFGVAVLLMAVGFYWRKKWTIRLTLRKG